MVSYLLLGLLFYSALFINLFLFFVGRRHLR
jgi:hypothetical protein